MNSNSKNEMDAVVATPKDFVVISNFTKICDNYYKVNLDAIVVENIDVDESDVLKFSNPRRLDATDSSGIGFGKLDMDELKESIRTNGLLTPLIGRIKNINNEIGTATQIISIINGHRRFQAILDLCEANAPCFDSITRQTINAKSLYSEVPFTIFEEINDLDCYLLSFEEDRTKVKFGPGTETRFVQHCRNRFINDAQILRMTGNTQEWLQDTYNLLDSLLDDAVVLNAFFNGEIDRGLAKHLATVDSKTDRHRMMRGAVNNAEDRQKIKIEKIDNSINAKLDKIESLTASKVIYEFSNKKEEADTKQQKIEELEMGIKEAKKKRNSSGSRAGKTDLKKTLIKSDNPNDKNSLPTTNRISVKWPEFFKTISDNGGAIPENEELILPDVLTRYSIDLLKSVENPKGNPVEFIHGWLIKFKSSGLQND